MRRPRFEDGKPAENLIGVQVKTDDGRLADVVGQEYVNSRSFTRLALRHFNGESAGTISYGSVWVLEPVHRQGHAFGCGAQTGKPCDRMPGCLQDGR